MTRLALADLLEENGDERADVVRGLIPYAEVLIEPARQGRWSLSLRLLAQSAMPLLIPQEASGLSDIAVRILDSKDKELWHYTLEPGEDIWPRFRLHRHMRLRAWPLSGLPWCLDVHVDWQYRHEWRPSRQYNECITLPDNQVASTTRARLLCLFPEAFQAGMVIR